MKFKEPKNSKYGFTSITWSRFKTQIRFLEYFIRESQIWKHILEVGTRRVQAQAFKSLTVVNTRRND